MTFFFTIILVIFTTVLKCALPNYGKKKKVTIVSLECLIEQKYFCMVYDQCYCCFYFVLTFHQNGRNIEAGLCAFLVQALSDKQFCFLYSSSSL